MGGDVADKGAPAVARAWVAAVSALVTGETAENELKRLCQAEQAQQDANEADPSALAQKVSVLSREEAEVLLNTVQLQWEELVASEDAAVRQTNMDSDTNEQPRTSGVSQASAPWFTYQRDRTWAGAVLALLAGFHGAE